MRLKRTIFAVMLVGLAIFLGLAVVQHYRLKRLPAAFREQLRQRGEKTTISELVPVPSTKSTNSLNGAFQLTTAASKLPEMTLNRGSMSYRGPSRARVLWQQTDLRTRYSTNQWSEVADALASNAVVLTQVRAALTNPVLLFKVDYASGIRAQLPHLAPAKKSMQWLSAWVIHNLHENQMEQVHQGLLAIISLVKGMRNERFLISYSVTLQFERMALGACWEALQHPAVTERQMAAWQREWQSVDLLTQAEMAHSFELALVESLFSEARKNANLFGGESTSDNAFAKIAFDVYLHGVWPLYDSYVDEYRSLWNANRAVESLRNVRKTAKYLLEKPRIEMDEAKLHQDYPASTLMSQMDLEVTNYVAPYLDEVAGAECVRQMLIAAIALQRYKLRHGQYPAKLDELAPDFVTKAPYDIMDGQPLRYRLNSDGSFLLYSIGANGKDDSGNATIDQPATNWLIGGRDWVWPKPATKSEAAAGEVEWPKKYPKLSL